MKVFILLAILSAVATAVPRPGHRLVGGSETVPGSKKHQVYLQWASSIGWNFYCGGVLISPTKVLTTAQCVDGQEAYRNQVMAGDHDRTVEEGTEQSSGWRGAAIHPLYDYEYPLDYDFAVITLSAPFVVTEYVQPITLLAPPNFTEPMSGDCMTSGWGSGGTVTPILQELNQKIVSRDACSQEYNNSGIQITERMLCAGETGGACAADQGGALVCQLNDGTEYLAGVISITEMSCGVNSLPTIYSNVAKAINWINLQIEM